jgi:hypothetical protein
VNAITDAAVFIFASNLADWNKPNEKYRHSL